MPDDILTTQLQQEQIEKLGEPLKDSRAAISNSMKQIETAMISCATNFAGFLDQLNGPNDLAAAAQLKAVAIQALEDAINGQEWRVRQHLKNVVETLAIDGDV